MKKVKYYYDKKTLSYKKIERSWKKRMKDTFVFLSASAFFAAIMLIAFFNFFDSPKEKMLIRELDNMACLLYTSPSPRDRQKSRMPSSA